MYRFLAGVKIWMTNDVKKIPLYMYGGVFMYMYPFETQVHVWIDTRTDLVPRRLADQNKLRYFTLESELGVLSK